MNKLIFCADDFGLSDKVNEGIYLLAQNGAINWISIVSNSYSDLYLNEIISLKKQDKIKIGIHLNITTFNSYFLNNIKSVIFEKSKIKQELERQYLLFKEKTGLEPDFIDGHHHMHQFPFIRKEVLNFVIDKKIKFVRNTHIKGHKNLKEYWLSFWGFMFKKYLKKYGINTNDNFLGVYDFKSDFKKLVLNGYKKAKDDDLTIFMCHPGLLELNKPCKEIYEQREIEYKVLKELNEKVY